MYITILKTMAFKNMWSFELITKENSFYKFYERKNLLFKTKADVIKEVKEKQKRFGGIIDLKKINGNS